MKIKPWGTSVIPKGEWIDPKKQYTCDGCRVIGLRIELYNSFGREVTYPVKGTVVLKEKPYKTKYCVWALDGAHNVVWPDIKFNLKRGDVMGEMREMTDKYWDCECESHYIHPVSKDFCPLCFAYQLDMPNSTIAEVIAAGFPIVENE